MAEESVIHGLDPRVKILMTFFYMVMVLLANNKYMFLLSVLIFALAYIPSKLPVTALLRGMKGFGYLLMVAGLVTLFFTAGDDLIHLGFVHISYTGLRGAVYLVLRLVMLLYGGAWLTYTTLPADLTRGLESLLSWLKIFKVPVGELAMILGIGLRFVPILSEEANRLHMAQLARGGEEEELRGVGKIKSMIPMIFPLFVSAIRHANHLSDAMESRCYRGSEGRTRYGTMRLGMWDVVGLVILGIYVAAMLILRIRLSTLLEILPI